MQELETESTSHADFKIRAEALSDELEFIRQEQEQELRELQGETARDTTWENQEYFRRELSSAIRSLREEYDQVKMNYEVVTLCVFRLAN